MNYEIIKPYIEKKLVTEQAHPEDPNVRIFNYTQTCQFEGIWDEVTMQCRGLIMNIKTGEILARPFPKFFNYQEHIAKELPMPDEEPIIREKMDGSLGIMYTLNDKVWIATRGSFTSDQAIWATKWWRENIGDAPMTNKITNLFEIIYPENRIVVNYDFSGLVYLASIFTETGHDCTNHPELMFGVPLRQAEKIDSRDLVELLKMEKENSEGFVIFYPKTNLRLKLKFPEYVRLHKLVTGVNEIAIWEYLRDGNGLEDLLEKVPDEFYKWVQQVQTKLGNKFEEIESWAEDDYQKALSASGLGTKELNAKITPEERKRFAIETQICKYPQIMFARLDNKPVAPIIWRMIRPHGQRQFKVDIDA